MTRPTFNGPRQTGRTYAMVKALPEGPVMIVAPSANIRQYIEHMVRDVTGRTDVRVVVFNHPRDEQKFRGLSSRVAIRTDHSLQDLLRYDARSAYHIALEQLRARGNDVQ